MKMQYFISTKPRATVLKIVDPTTPGMAGL